MAIRNVVLAGTSGNLGPAILSAVSSSLKFTVTVFTRAGSSPPTLPLNVKSLKVNYDSIDDLTAHLRNLNTDAVVSTISHTAGSAQTNLIRAAATAGVSRFLPSEFGSDLDNAINRVAPAYAPKIAAQELLKELAGEGKITYTVVYNGAFLDWGLAVGFPISPARKTAVLHDGGHRVYSTTTLKAVGQAVVGVLSHPEETENRVVRVGEATTTLQELLEIAKEVVGTDGWEVTEPDVESEVEKASALLKQGVVSRETIMPFIYRAIWGEGAGGLFERTDNELLGIETLDRQGLKRIIEEVVKK
ncbi:aromatic alcohol reductase [Aspergillus undulatus]|uniref:aromatic alcohol reductase n=1 Tax=Aspergillus undulatus TaxID=1810928 RepID=UPI003CCDB657